METTKGSSTTHQKHQITKLPGGLQSNLTSPTRTQPFFLLVFSCLIVRPCYPACISALVLFTIKFQLPLPKERSRTGWPTPAPNFMGIFGWSHFFMPITMNKWMINHIPQVSHFTYQWGVIFSVISIARSNLKTILPFHTLIQQKLPPIEAMNHSKYTDWIQSISNFVENPKERIDQEDKTVSPLSEFTKLHPTH